jgi:hypothetical protein
MERNSDNSKQPDKSTPEKNIDSPINMEPAEGSNEDLHSLTPDEDASVDPNTVEDKPTFKSAAEEENRENNTGRFDGTVGI